MASHLYWRINILASSSASYAAVGELQLRATVGGADLTDTAGGTPMSGSDYSVFYVASKAFDGDVATSWRNKTNEPLGWLGYQFPSPVEVLEVALSNGSNLSTAYTPKDFYIEASDDGVTWYIFASVTGQTGWTSGETRTFAVPATAPLEASLVSQLPTLVIDKSDQASQVSQLPILVVQGSPGKIDISQFPVLIVGTPGQPLRVTQMPVLVQVLLRDIPPPNPILPEIPVTETWLFNTTVAISAQGYEQRAMLRENPRIGISYDILMLSDLDRQAVYSMIYEWIGKEFTYPVYQYSVTLTARADVGATGVLFDATKTDIRSGELMAVFNPHTEQTRFIQVDTVSDTGATLAAALTEEIPGYCLVCPAYAFRFAAMPGFTMDSLSGTFTMRLESTRSRDLERVSGAALLTTYDGWVILDRRPLVSANESFYRGIEWLDVGTAIPEAIDDYLFASVSGSRRFTFDRYRDTAYWRAFAQYCQGRQNSFLLPTFRNDLPLSEPAIIGSNSFKTANLYARAMIMNGPYDYGLVEMEVGSFYCRINDATVNYDDEGNAVTLTISLNKTITSPIKKVSFMNTMRLDDDAIEIEHSYVDSQITLDMKAVIQ